VFVFAAGGAVLGGVLAASSLDGPALGIALGGGGGAFIGLIVGWGGGGAFIGLIVGWGFRWIQSFWAGALLGGMIPILLVLKDAAARGRLDPEEMMKPESLLVIGCIMGAGAAVGMLLVGVKKLFLRLFRGAPRTDAS
jgi:hypothetical protein